MRATHHVRVNGHLFRPDLLGTADELATKPSRTAQRARRRGSAIASRRRARNMTQPRYNASTTPPPPALPGRFSTRTGVCRRRGALRRPWIRHVVIADTDHMTTSGGLSHLAAQARPLGAASRSRVVGHLAAPRHLLCGHHNLQSGTTTSSRSNPFIHAASRLTATAAVWADPGRNGRVMALEPACAETRSLCAGRARYFERLKALALLRSALSCGVARARRHVPTEEERDGPGNGEDRGFRPLLEYLLNQGR